MATRRNAKGEIPTFGVAKQQPGPLSKIPAAFRLVRFEHALMFALSVLVAEIIASQGIPAFTIPLILSLLVPIFSEMGAFAMNDLLDVETDRLNKKRERPLVSGELSEDFALILTVSSFALALACAFFVNWTIFLLTAALIFLAALYNFVLKDLPLVGNAYIAFTMGIPFIFGNYAVSPALEPVNIIIALLGFLAGLAREIVKSAEDIEGDKKARKSKTLPILIGMKPALWIAGLLYALFVFCSFLPYQSYLKIGIGFAIVLIADALFAYSAIVLVFSRHRTQFLRTSRNLSLLGLFLGLLGILVSVLGY